MRYSIIIVIYFTTQYTFKTPVLHFLLVHLFLFLIVDGIKIVVDACELGPLRAISFHSKSFGMVKSISHRLHLLSPTLCAGSSARLSRSSSLGLLIRRMDQFVVDSLLPFIWGGIFPFAFQMTLSWIRAANLCNVFDLLRAAPMLLPSNGPLLFKHDRTWEHVNGLVNLHSNPSNKYANYCMINY